MNTLTPLTLPEPFDFFGIAGHKLYAEGVSDINYAAFRKSGKTYYINYSEGNDSNDGLTPSSAFKNLATAVTQPDVDVIIAAPGRYYFQFFGDVNNLRGYSLVCETGIAEFCSSNEDDSLNFSDDGTGNDTYVWTGSGDCNSVWDEAHENSFGGWGWLQEQSSAADVRTSGGWFSDGTDTWVKTEDARAPDDKIRVNRSNVLYLADSTTTGEDFYIENCRFYGGNVRYNGTPPDVRTVLVNCHFGYCGSGSGINASLTLQTAPTQMWYLYRCQTYSGYLDGFSWRDSTIGIEERCSAYDFPKTGSNNCSTSHTNCKPIRVNGAYHDCGGDVIADVHNTASFNLNLYLRNGDLDGTSFFGDFRADSNAALEGMWCVNCFTSGSSSPFSTLGGGTIRHQNCNFSKPNESGTTLVGETFFQIPTSWQQGPVSETLVPLFSPVRKVTELDVLSDRFFLDGQWVQDPGALYLGANGGVTTEPNGPILNTIQVQSGILMLNGAPVPSGSLLYQGSFWGLTAETNGKAVAEVLR